MLSGKGGRDINIDRQMSEQISDDWRVFGDGGELIVAGPMY